MKNLSSSKSSHWERLQQQVFIRGYELYLVLGVHKHERMRRQKIVVSLQATVNFDKAAVHDNLQDTLNYETLHKNIANLGEQKKYHTLEAFAWDIAELTMENKNVLDVWVEAKKSNVLLYAKDVGVSIKASK